MKGCQPAPNPLYIGVGVGVPSGANVRRARLPFVHPQSTTGSTLATPWPSVFPEGKKEAETGLEPATALINANAWAALTTGAYPPPGYSLDRPPVITGLRTCLHLCFPSSACPSPSLGARFLEPLRLIPMMFRPASARSSSPFLGLHSRFLRRYLAPSETYSTTNRVDDGARTRDLQDHNLAL